MANSVVFGVFSTKEQVEDYLKAVKKIGFLKAQEGLQLGPHSRLTNFAVNPNPIVSGAPLHLSMELESSVAMRINELAVLIHDALSRRIAILDLRSANGCYRTNGLDPTVFGVDVTSFPLVEGDYYLSIFIDSDDIVAEFRDLVSLTVIDDQTRREIITYPPRARGSVELDYRLRPVNINDRS